jgi:hypothetical protein
MPLSRAFSFQGGVDEELSTEYGGKVVKTEMKRDDEVA